jgi:hypothetical protein
MSETENDYADQSEPPHALPNRPFRYRRKSEDKLVRGRLTRVVQAGPDQLHAMPLRARGHVKIVAKPTHQLRLEHLLHKSAEHFSPHRPHMTLT